jgi:outer membrane protein
LKNSQFLCSALILAAATTLAHAQSTTPTKIGIINVEAAILSTREGKKAADELNSKFTQKKADLDKKQAGIDQLKDQLQKGSATMSDEAKNKLMRQIDGETTSLKRATEDAQADMQQDEGKIINELGAKLYAIVQKYAKDNGYAIILDVSAQQQPVWWAADGIVINNEVVALYDKANPGPAAAGSAKPAGSAPAPAARPTAPAATTPPTSGAPTKKQ